MTQAKPTPTTDTEWTIHAMNIHGTFFERWCAKVVNDTDGFILESTNYPVEFPSSNNGVRGKESALDIRARTVDYDKLLTLIIECKKNNPEFIDWIFFPSQSRLGYVELPIIMNQPLSDSPNGWKVKAGRGNKHFSLPVADEARETKGDYQSISNASKTKTKTANDSISGAAYQVALATQAVFIEEMERSKNRSTIADARNLSWKWQVLFPVIITTARLFTCDFDSSDIDPRTGEIPFGKAELTEQPSLIFNYSLPRHLQYIPEGIESADRYFKVEDYMQMQIMIVHSVNFPAFLKQTREEMWTFFLVSFDSITKTFSNCRITGIYRRCFRFIHANILFLCIFANLHPIAIMCETGDAAFSSFFEHLTVKVEIIKIR